MRLLPVFPFLVIFIVLTGCGTTVERSSLGGWFDVRQHFSNGSRLEADSIAMNQCRVHNGIAKLINFQRGCMFGCPTEFHLYSYECVSNERVAEEKITTERKKMATDSDTCSQWGFKKETEAFANCMMRLYEVRMAVELATEKNKQIKELTNEQRRQAELYQTMQLLNLNSQIVNQYKPKNIVPFTCTRLGNFVNCR